MQLTGKRWSARGVDLVWTWGINYSEFTNAISSTSLSARPIKSVVQIKKPCIRRAESALKSFLASPNHAKPLKTQCINASVYLSTYAHNIYYVK